MSQLSDYPSPEHARWGQGATLRLTEQLYLPAESPLPLHPTYNILYPDLLKWRHVYESGRFYIDTYLRHYSRRESAEDFNLRKEISPDGSFAAEVIDEIKNSIFQRLTEVVRVGGSDSYQNAIQGQWGGVDLNGANLNWFIGHYILPELLVMQKVGIYVDSPAQTPTLLNKSNLSHPYLYSYHAEDMLNWGDRAVLLRDHTYDYAPDTNLPVSCTEKFRLVYIPSDGYVHVRIYTKNPDSRSTDAYPKDKWMIEEVTLAIRQLPFVCFEITKSLMKSVATTQIALTNLESSDISYTLQANYPFYIEQYDNRYANTKYIKSAQVAYTEQLTQLEQLVPGQEDCTITEEPSEQASTGATQGRRYPIGTNPPAFINPSAEPLRVSMEKQKELKDDIRKLVHLALSSVQSKAASADSKAIDQQGLEAGLSYIGLELETGERKIAEIWNEYESTNQVATINYPERWSLKSLSEVKEEVDQATSLRDDIPSPTFKLEMNKKIVDVVLGIKVTASTIDKINKELSTAKGSTSNPTIIATDLTMGTVSKATASILRGYPEGESDAANKDHLDKLAAIAQSQSSPNTNPIITNPAARGLPELGGDPNASSKEKQGKPQRGKGN